MSLRTYKRIQITNNETQTEQVFINEHRTTHKSVGTECSLSKGRGGRGEGRGKADFEVRVIRHIKKLKLQNSDIKETPYLKKKNK